MSDYALTPLAMTSTIVEATAQFGSDESSMSKPIPDDCVDDQAPELITVSLPRHLYEEVSYVAECEECEVPAVVISALEQYLADHWVSDRRS